MKKLLIIDDKILNDENHDNIAVAERWKKEKIIGYSHLIEVYDKSNAHFFWDSNCQNCRLLFNKDDYQYVFLHHSQKNDSMVSSTAIDLVKRELGEKLILFSGSINENFLNRDVEGFTFRSISRDKLWRKFAEFIKKSVLLDTWTIEILYYAIDQYLIKRIILMQDTEVSTHIISRTSEFQQLLRLKYIPNGSEQYNRIISLDGHELINELRDL